MRKVSFLWLLRSTFVGIVIFCSPLLLNIFALLIAQVSGCTIGYFKPDPCILWGLDFGTLITIMDRTIVIYPYTHILGWLYFFYLLFRYFISFFLVDDED